jgi:hypothetical protein
MLRPRHRQLRAAALLSVLLLGFSSTRAAVAFERDLFAPDRHEIAAFGYDGEPASEPTSIASQLALAICAQSALAPRTGELRQPSETRAAPRSLVVTSCEPDSPVHEDPGTHCPGSGELTRWCLAHATSTDDP